MSTSTYCYMGANGSYSLTPFTGAFTCKACICFFVHLHVCLSACYSVCLSQPTDMSTMSDACTNSQTFNKAPAPMDMSVDSTKTLHVKFLLSGQGRMWLQSLPQDVCRLPILRRSYHRSTQKLRSAKDAVRE